MPIHLQELIFSSSNTAISTEISKLEADGKIKKIAPRIYTGKINEKPESIIRRNIFSILGKQYRGAVLSHRSALEFKPTTTGNIFLTYTYTKKIKLPGITLRILEGPGPIEGDNKFFGELYVSQQARAFLENMQISKKQGPDSKTIPISGIEEKLEKIIQIHGEDEVKKLRDQAKKIANELQMQDEFEKLNKLISTLLTTHTAKILDSPVARARALGNPYDPERIRLFETLFVELQQREFKKRPDKNETEQSFNNFAFFESYFSNYIEGTVFDVAEAKEIIETQKPMPTRDEDSHDILGTYHIVSNRQEMMITPGSPERLLEILQYRHKILLSARTNKSPGLFKDKNNFSGNTAFVDFNLVRGTLTKGFEYFTALRTSFGKAIYMMFLISEVHPFLDGNGRVARIMMNAEFAKEGESKIIVPTVYRDDYLGSLRRLTRQSDPDAYIRAMQRLHEFSENICDDDIDAMEGYLKSCDSFLEPTEGKLKILPNVKAT